MDGVLKITYGIIFGFLITGLLMADQQAFAGAPSVGDVLRTLDIESIRTASSFGCSIGVAFDGTHLYLDFCNDPLIYKVNTDGTLDSTFSSGVTRLPNAMAFDATRNGLWIGSQSCDEGGMEIYFHDFDTTTTTLAFTIPFGLTNPATGESFLNFCFDDGLTFNANGPGEADDEIWFSDDVNRNIGVFRPDGTLVTIETEESSTNSN